MKPRDPSVVGLAILDGYKVRWNRETVARDIVQNFFDEVGDFREVAIDVDAEAGRVRVAGPSRFDLDYLRYIGATTKNVPERRSAGGFGEGFKICALVLLRDYRCEVKAGSGSWEIRPVLRPMKLGRELCYEVRKRAPFAGSFVEIEGADELLCRAFAGAKDLFRHQDNPRLKSPIHVDEAAGVGVYVAADSRSGDLYYRRQHRGRVRFARGGALTFAFDDRLEALDGDRDRRNMRAAAPLVAAAAKRLPDAVLEQLVRHLRAYWQGGSAIFSAVLAEAKRRGLSLAFGRRWLARVKYGFKLERHAERLGFHLGVPRLADVGMPTVEARFGMTAKPRAPTPVESARMRVARALYLEIAGSPPLFERQRVVDLDEAAEALPWGSRSCVAAARHLASPFGTGMAPCLAALAMGTGLEARRNGDRLTALLEGAVRRAGTLDAYRERWERAAVDPSPELGADGATEEEEDEDVAPSLREGLLLVELLAPSGFPLAGAFRARLEALGKELRLPVRVATPTVDSERHALAHYARGVPSVWIEDREIEPPPRGTRPSFSVRTFSAPEGRGLLPSDEVLREALLAAGAPRARRRRRGARCTAGGRALLGWSRRHAPDEYRRLRIDAAVSGVPLDTAGLEPPLWQTKLLTRALAMRSLFDRPWEEARLADEVPGALAAGQAAVRALVGALEAEAPGIAGDGGSKRLALQEALEKAADVLSRGAGAEEARSYVIGIAAPLAALERRATAAPLDEHCVGACAAAGFEALWRALPPIPTPPDAGALERALALAVETLDGAVVHAMERHEQTDARGNPLSCYELGGSLRARFGWGPPENGVAEAVAAAWEAARGEGLSEIEAMGRCVEAAREAAEVGG